MPATKRKFAAPVGLFINSVSTVDSSIASTSPSSGAFVITGGAGIGQSVSIGGRLQLFNGANYTSFVSSASGNTVYSLPATSPAIGSSVLQSTSAGVMSWVPMTATSSGTGFTTLNALTAGIQYFATGSSGSSFNISSTGSTHTFNIPIAGSGSTGLVTNLAQTIAGAKTFSSALNISDSTNSSSSSTGALIVTGGAGIGGTLTIGSDLRSPSFVTRKLTTVTLGATINNYVEFLTITGGLNGGYNLLISINNNLAGTNIQTNKIYAISGNYGSSPDWKVVSPISEQASNSQSGAWELLILETQGDLIFRLRNKIGFVGTSTNSINIYNLDGNNLLTFTQSNTTGTDATAYTLSGGSPLMIIGANTQAGQGQVAIATPYAYSSTTALTVSGSAAITGSTASTSTTSGALIVTGGVGIGQSVSVGGRLQMFNGANYTAFVSSASGNTVYTLPATSPATGTSVLQSTSAGVMSWVAMAATSGGSGTTSANVNIVAAGNANVFHSVLFTPSPSSSGSAISSDSTISFNPSTEILNVSGLAITSGTASTNTTTGALVVRGGLGVTGQLSFSQASFGFTGITTNPSMSFIGATTSSPITLTVLTDNSLNFEGSQGSVFSIDSNLSSGEIFAVSDISGLPIISASAGQTVNVNEFGGYTQIGNGSINSSSTSTGSLVIAGGLGFTGNAFIGGTTTITNLTSSSSTSSGSLVLNGGLGISGNAFIGGTTTITNLTSSSSTNSGSLVLNGGLGISGNAFIGGTTTITNLTSSSSVSSGSLVIRGGLGISGNAFIGGTTTITNLTSSSSVSSGSLVLNGGLGISGNAFIGGTTTVTSTTASISSSSGALVVAGGVGIGQTLFIGGNLYQNTNAITAFDTGFRNRIINGDGNIDQRSDGSSTTPGVGATNFIDRWKMNVFGSGRLTIGKNYGAVSSPDGFVSYIGMKTTTTSTPGANDYNFLSQVIEGVNTIDLQWGTANAKPLALSFWAYSSLTGTFGGSIRNYGTYNRSYPFTYTISSSNTWEKKTVVISGDTTGTWTTSHLFGIEIIFSIANGTGYQATPFAWAAGNFTGPSGSLVNLIGTLNATLYLTGIQAEIGSVATPYERRNYGHEFALCQRYYQITEVRTGGYHTTGNFLRGSVFLNTAARPISSPVFTVLSTDESNNHGTLNVDNSNFRGDSFRYLVQVTTTGDAFGQWKVGADFEF